MPKNKKRTFNIRTKHGSYQVVIWLDKKDNAYLVKGISLPEVVTCGINLAEAKRMAKDALELYCDCSIAEGKIVVDDQRKVFGQLPDSRVISLVR